jgi:hypothetical protein
MPNKSGSHSPAPCRILIEPKYIRWFGINTNEEFIKQGFAPARRGPFVSAKGPKTILACARPLRPCSEASSPGSLVHHPESRWLRNSLRSDSLRQRGRVRGGGPAASNAGEEYRDRNKFYLKCPKSIEGFSFGGHSRLRMRRSRNPESTSWRELFERSEFSRHFIRGVGEGTWKRMGSFSAIL